VYVTRGSQAIPYTKHGALSKSNIDKSADTVSPQNLSKECDIGVAWSRGLLLPSWPGALPSVCTVSFNEMIW
jgi:hypothetical protein